MRPKISRATFTGMPTKDKLNVLFDLATKSAECADDTSTKVENLKTRIDRGRKIDLTTATAAGFIGGIVAHIGQWILTGGQKPV